jgi:geranylgeranyl diphosphate synthase type I
MSVASNLDELAQQVDAEIGKNLTSRQMELYRMMSFHLGWEDKPGGDQGPVRRDRTHGGACMIACAAAGGEPESALPAAAAVELVESFSQIHDDVQSGQPVRFDRDALWWVWGPAQAINAGDAMHAVARLAVFALAERGATPEVTFRAVQVVDRAVLELCEGRFKDLESQERIDLDVDGYLDMAAGKTGALYACAMELGALAASADDATIQAMRTCGKALGIALQMRRDVMELWGDGDSVATPGAEVLNKKKLFPVVYSLSKASQSEKRRLGDIYFKRVLDTEDVAKVRDILDELGARDRAGELVAQYRTAAAAAIDIPGVSAAGRSAISDLADYLLGG